MMERVFFGLKSFFKGFHVIRKYPSLSRFIIIPILISIVVAIIGLYFSWTMVPAFLAEYFPLDNSAWGKSIYWISVVVMSLLASLLVILNSFVLVNLLNIPMNTKLCESYLKKEFQWSPPHRSIKDSVKTFLYFLGIGLVKTFIIISLGFMALLLSFVPFLGLIAAILATMVLAFDCSDITFEIKEWNLKKRWRFYKAHKVEFLGFSLGIAVFSVIPGLNFILLPFIVLGASHMVHTLDTRINHDSMPSS
jgi:CysZ protein